MVELLSKEFRSARQLKTKKTQWAAELKSFTFTQKDSSLLSEQFTLNSYIFTGKFRDASKSYHRNN